MRSLYSYISILVIKQRIWQYGPVPMLHVAQQGSNMRSLSHLPYR